MMNILWIITDQQSPDTHGTKTPTLDALARRGTTYSQAYCAHPLCGPSRSSLFSGQYAHQTGILTNKSTGDLCAKFPCIGRTLAQGGYQTGHIGKWHMAYDPADRQGHGFAFLENSRHNGADQHNLASAEAFFDQLNGARPFFLVASYNNPHNICEWARGARRGELEDGDIGDPPHDLPAARRHSPPQANEPDTVSALRESYQATSTFPVGNFSDRDWQQYQWAYDRMIELVDGHIGQLLALMESRGLLHNTAIVFTSDHGDAQGAHGWSQKTVLLEESVRVPLILCLPDPVNRGNVSTHLVQTGIDLYPTFCDIAQVPAPDGLQGRSLLADAENSEIMVQTTFAQGSPDSLGHSTRPVHGRLLRKGDWKYCLYSHGNFRESLVDLASDPDERFNLAHDPARAANLIEMRQLLRSVCERTGDAQGLAMIP